MLRVVCQRKVGSRKKTHEMLLATPEECELWATNLIQLVTAAGASDSHRTASRCPAVAHVPRAAHPVSPRYLAQIPDPVAHDTHPHPSYLCTLLSPACLPDPAHPRHPQPGSVCAHPAHAGYQAVGVVEGQGQEGEVEIVRLQSDMLKDERFTREQRQKSVGSDDASSPASRRRHRKPQTYMRSY
jgi:hypothetical protein